MFSRIWTAIKEWLQKMLGTKSIEQALHVTPAISSAMEEAIELWGDIYEDKAPWLSEEGVFSLNLGAQIASEKARQVCLEMKSEISAPAEKDEETGEEIPLASTERADYLNAEYEKLLRDIRRQLEYGIAKGGLIIKPYPQDGHIYFNYCQANGFFPISFDGAGRMLEAAFTERLTNKDTVYTRLEYHKLEKNTCTVMNKAYKSIQRDNESSDGYDLGTEIPLNSISAWADLEEETTIQDVDRLLFAYFKMPEANTIDSDSPLGVSGFARAVKLIEQADRQYSRLLWEFEGGELAIDADRDALTTRRDAEGNDITILPALQKRLFRKVDLNDESAYNVFSPALRDTSYLNGLNNILMAIEDKVGLSRGTLSDVTAEARTATELKILKQRSYATINDIQKSLQLALDDVIYVMNVYTTLYNLAPEGEYEVAYEWDDSIITDTNEELSKRLQLLNNGIESRVGLRMWYFGETESQARQALAEIDNESLQKMEQEQQIAMGLSPSEQQPANPAIQAKA